MTKAIDARTALLALALGLGSLASLTTAAPAAKASAAATPAPAPTGAPASLPDLSLPDLEGKSHASKEWQDKVVVLDFWATWCTGCRETIPVLIRLQEKFGAKGLAVTGISVDKEGPKEKIAKFVRKQKMSYPILWDAGDTMSKLFGFEGIPSVFVYGRDGHLLKALPAYTAAQEKDLEAVVEAQFQGKP